MVKVLTDGIFNRQALRKTY